MVFYRAEAQAVMMRGSLATRQCRPVRAAGSPLCGKPTRGAQDYLSAPAVPDENTLLSRWKT
jgi:hypothetical protein